MCECTYAYAYMCACVSHTQVFLCIYCKVSMHLSLCVIPTYTCLHTHAYLDLSVLINLLGQNPYNKPFRWKLSVSFYLKFSPSSKFHIWFHFTLICNSTSSKGCRKKMQTDVFTFLFVSKYFQRMRFGANIHWFTYFSMFSLYVAKGVILENQCILVLGLI